MRLFFAGAMFIIGIEYFLNDDYKSSLIYFAIMGLNLWTYTLE